MSDTSTITVPTVPGTPFAGGFYAGSIFIDNALCALIVAPKAEGECSMPWNDSYADINGAKSFCDGLSNTKAMAEVGSDLAKWALQLNIGGFSDWYLPSQDELEILYRHLKPTTNHNYLYGRSGINVSAAPSTYPYTAESPAQTTASAFRENGAEAFDADWYWSSTQYAAYPGYAWVQSFGDGGQGYDHKSNEFRARAVRRFFVIE